MLRFTMLVLAFTCAINCFTFAQQPATQQAPPPGQTTPGATATPAPAPVTTNVPMSETVLTLKGACQSKSGNPAEGCVSSLTREQFEKLTNALQPADKGAVPPEVRRRFATQYAKLLTFADAARELGLENDPKVHEIYKFAMTQILAESLNQHYMDAYAHPTDQQVQEYYDQNAKKYKEVTLQRIIIPVNQGNADKPKPTEDEMKAYAVKIRERWVAGEDPVTLQKEAMEHNGVKTTAPDVNVGPRRPGSLPQAHEVVFDMKANEITDPFSDAAAVYIYKIVSVRQVPVSEVKAQISQTLQHQLYTDKIQQIQSSVTPVLNEAYFGPETPQAAPGMRPGMPGMPPNRPGAPPMPGAGAPPPANSGASPK
jgi:hypothetical protein